MLFNDPSTYRQQQGNMREEKQVKADDRSISLRHGYGPICRERGGSDARQNKIVQEPTLTLTLLINFC